MRDRELLKGQDATRLILDAKKAPLLAVLIPIGRWADRVAADHQVPVRAQARVPRLFAPGWGDRAWLAGPQCGDVMLVEMPVALTLGRVRRVQKCRRCRETIKRKESRARSCGRLGLSPRFRSRPGLSGS